MINRNPLAFGPISPKTSAGLKAEGRLILSTVKGRETYELLKAGALDGFSIGYKTIRDRIDAKSVFAYSKKSTSTKFPLSLFRWAMTPAWQR